MIYVFLANGFEITEAMAPVDMMRRAKLDVKTVGIGADVIESSCGVKVVADIREKDVDMNEIRRICSENTIEELEAEFEKFKKEFVEKHKNDESTSK